MFDLLTTQLVSLLYASFCTFGDAIALQQALTATKQQAWLAVMRSIPKQDPGPTYNWLRSLEEYETMALIPHHITDDEWLHPEQYPFVCQHARNLRVDLRAEPTAYRDDTRIEIACFQLQCKLTSFGWLHHLQAVHTLTLKSSKQYAPLQLRLPQLRSLHLMSCKYRTVDLRECTQLVHIRIASTASTWLFPPSLRRMDLNHDLIPVPTTVTELRMYGNCRIAYAESSLAQVRTLVLYHYHRSRTIVETYAKLTAHMPVLERSYLALLNSKYNSPENYFQHVSPYLMIKICSNNATEKDCRWWRNKLPHAIVQTHPYDYEYRCFDDVI